MDELAAFGRWVAARKDHVQVQIRCRRELRIVRKPVRRASEVGAMEAQQPAGLVHHPVSGHALGVADAHAPRQILSRSRQLAAELFGSGSSSVSCSPPDRRIRNCDALKSTSKGGWYYT